MSDPTVAAEKFRKVIGYLHNTSDFAVVLEKPIAGHRRCKSTDGKVWILESFSDVDWSSNRVHRRSTSCGIHLLDGQMAYGSSRTQRVISLPSCESELRGLVPTLLDGVYIKTCFEFVVGTSIEHVSLTGSSGAGQLVNGQDTGKLKHVDCKILWIQGHVRQGSRCICQVSKNGDRTQLSKLTKAVAMIVLVMGLEPSVAAGTIFFGKDGRQCEVGVSPNDAGDEHFSIFFLLLLKATKC
jgi:hypothetical protein